MTTWRTQDEWKLYSGCADLGEQWTTEGHLDVVRPICKACVVRPECIKWALDPSTGRGILKDDVSESGQLEPRRATEVVAAGVWIPDEDHPDYDVTLDKLALMLEYEYKKRGDV